MANRVLIDKTVLTYTRLLLESLDVNALDATQRQYRAAVLAECQRKIDAEERRAAYTDYKTSNDPQAREAARKAYLDASGIPESYRTPEEVKREDL